MSSCRPPIVAKSENNSSSAVKIGIIGGSGLEDADFLANLHEKDVTTPFGQPSDTLKVGEIDGVSCVLLSRHGRGHHVSPTFVNYRANVWALDALGCTHLLVTTACGSLKEEIEPGHVVFLDQFIDRTNRRVTTFFDGVTKGAPVGVCHVPMHTPFCPKMIEILADSAAELDMKHHTGGTAVCIEGPRFSTKAESNLFRSWNGSVVNMTTVPEVTLAAELGLCYAAIALPTDYDCWREGHEHVSVDMVLKTFYENSHKAKNLIRLATKKMAQHDWTEYIDCLKKMAKSSVMLPKGETKTHV